MIRRKILKEVLIKTNKKGFLRNFKHVLRNPEKFPEFTDQF